MCRVCRRQIHDSVTIDVSLSLSTSGINKNILKIRMNRDIFVLDFAYMPKGRTQRGREVTTAAPTLSCMLAFLGQDLVNSDDLEGDRSWYTNGTGAGRGGSPGLWREGCSSHRK